MKSKSILKVIKKSFRRRIKQIKVFIGNNLYYMSIMIDAILPYLMLIIGEYVYKQRSTYVIGGELLVPVFVTIISTLIRDYADESNKGKSIPLPRDGKRYTYVDKDDNVSIVQSNYKELLIYVSEVEDYLERIGKI